MALKCECLRPSGERFEDAKPGVIYVSATAVPNDFLNIRRWATIILAQSRNEIAFSSISRVSPFKFLVYGSSSRLGVCKNFYVVRKRVEIEFRNLGILEFRI